MDKKTILYLKFDIVKYSYLTDKIIDYTNYHKNPSNYFILNLQPNKPNHRIQTIYELSIPTCSYRMGVPDMGFGMLTLSNLSLNSFSQRTYIKCPILVYEVFPG
jgi:hypothetical protein